MCTFICTEDSKTYASQEDWEKPLKITVNFSPLLHSDVFNGIRLYLIHTNRAESSLLSETDMDWINSLYLEAKLKIKKRN